MSSPDDRDEPAARAARRAPADGAATDRQTLIVRRAIAIAIGVALLLALVFLVRGCFDARAERALTDYARDTNVLVQESNRQSEQFFGLLRNSDRQSPVDLQNTVNGIGVRADRLVDRSRALEAPGELEETHGFLEETLAFRRDGVTAIARRLPAALGDDRRADASRQIAAQMQNFTASDVIHSQRFVPGMRTRLREEELLGAVNPAPSAFLRDIAWLRPQSVTSRLERIRTGQTGGEEGPTGGLRGSGLGAVTVLPAGTALTEGSAIEIQSSEDLALRVEVQNQGEQVEQDLRVQVTITGGIRLRDTIATIEPGESQTVSIPLPNPPPAGQPVSIEVEVAPVRGERMRDNNSATYRAIFNQ